MAPASVKDVASLAGVSLGTVSNVLNRPATVRPVIRARVEAAIEQLGFVRNESARQLRAGTSRLIAYMFPDASNPFFTDVARHAQERAREAQLVLVLCDSDADAATEDDYLDLLQQQRVRGVLITAMDYKNPRLRELSKRGIALVLVDRIEGENPFACSIGVDDVTGGWLAVTHLIEQGHERIAFVGTPGAYPQVKDRYRGALKALGDHGLPLEELVVIEASRLTADAGRTAGQRILGIPVEERPTAAFCANDLLALGLLQEMTLQGLRVPEDLAIVGYDDIDFAQAATVPLTSVRQPRDQLGERAVDLILAESSAAGEHHHEQVILRPELVVRTSSRSRSYAEGTTRGQ